MKLACLILASKAPRILARVAKVYRDADFDVFVHLDAKFSKDDYVSAMGGPVEGCRFIERRRTIFWAGYSMIEATAELIDAAREWGSYSHFALLSDDSAPIVSPAYLNDNLLRGVNRISIRRLDRNEAFYGRYERFYHFDHAATSLHGRPVESAFVDAPFHAAMDRMRDLMRSGKADIPVFYGSQWWCLTAATVEGIMREHAANERLRTSFEFSAVPDEIYFQTLVANLFPPSRMPTVNSPVHVEWGRFPKPFVYLDPAEVPALDTSQQLFVRKFSNDHPEVVDALLQRPS